MERLELPTQTATQGLALIGQLTALVLEPATLVGQPVALAARAALGRGQLDTHSLDLRQQPPQVPMLGAQQLLGPVQPGPRQTETARQRQRLAAARCPGAQTEGGLAALGVELHRRAPGAIALERRGRQRRQMGGQQSQPPLVQQHLEQGDRQGRALLRVGPRAQLVDQHQTAGPGRLPDLPQPLQPAAEGRAVAQEVLLVADRRRHPVEHRQPGSGSRKDGQTALVGQNRQPDRLQGYRLAARVGPGHHHQPPVVSQLELRRHRAAGVTLLAERRQTERRQAWLQQRMVSANQPHLEVAGDLGQAAVRGTGVAPGGLQRVEHREEAENLAEGSGLPARLGHEIVDDPLPFGLFFGDRLPQPVVALDRRQRLEVDTLPARRAPVYQARQPPA